MGEIRLDRLYSKGEYLEILKASESKYEYVDGFLVGMSGGSLNHNRISRNFMIALSVGMRAQGGDCEVFGSDQKVSIPARNSYFFPDVSVVCPPIETDATDGDALLNPVLVVEVASKSTRQYDAGGKFNYYQTLPSLQEFILVEQDLALVTVYRQTRDGAWRIEQINEMEGVLEIQSLGVSIQMQEIYQNVQWAGDHSPI